MLIGYKTHRDVTLFTPFLPCAYICVLKFVIIIISYNCGSLLSLCFIGLSRIFVTIAVRVSLMVKLRAVGI